MSVKRLYLLAALGLSLYCQAAEASDYEINPDAPNGYAASMAAYHYHGSYRAPTEEQNGYAATAVRSRYGLDPLLVPKSSEGGESDGGWGGSRWSSGSSGDQSGGDYWGQHFRRRCQPQASQGLGVGFGQQHPGEMVAGAALTAGAMREYRNYRSHSPGPAPLGVNRQNFQTPQSYSGGYQSNSSAQQYGTNVTALRRAVNAEPVRSMLRSSEGGFNRIYSGE
jgi:hypothetical protein